LPANDDALRAQARLDLLLEANLLGGQVVVVLDELLEVAPGALFGVISLVDARSPPV
jgi:hypothetical protein